MVEPRALMIKPGSVWLDAQGTQNPLYGERGIARYVGAHTRGLVDAGNGTVGAVCLDPELPLPESLAPLEASGVLRWRPGQTARIDETPRLYHVMSPVELPITENRIWPPVARRAGVRTAVTLYDLIPLVFRDKYLDPAPAVAAQYMARVGLIRAADHVFTISQWTAKDAIDHLGIPEERITVIDCGVSPALPALVSDPDEAAEILREAHPRIREGFLLYVGGDEWRKNLDGLLRAYARLSDALRAERQLVIVCSMRPHRIAELTARARSLGIDSGDLVLTGHVPDRELVALYRRCGLFVFPSLYEGAGLPVLEAMSCDAPVAASRAASIPEILGDDEATFDPRDEADIARCLEQSLSNPSLLESLRERSRIRAGIFTWERVAERTLAGYEKALARESRRRSGGRKRLAVVTPWPPQPSGVADHSYSLVKELSRLVEVDVISPREPGIEFDRSLEPDVGMWNEIEEAWLPGVRGYDRLLYVLGSSRFHTEIFRLLMNRPGAVLLHDVRMLGLYSHLSWDEQDPQWLRSKIVEMYGERIPPRERKRAFDEDVFVPYRIYMTHEIQANAETILMHSRFQQGVLREDAPAVAAPSAVVPHGIREAPPAARSERFRRTGPLVVSYGIVSTRIKRLDLVLEAFAAVCAAQPDAMLLIVGEVPPADRRAIRRIASRLGINEGVELFGRADRRSYWEILGAADLAVQLRTGVQGGEASGAVCDCIAARVPTIVSDIGWFSELPDDVVSPVPEDCSAEQLVAEMSSLLTDRGRRDAVRFAQDRYAEETSYPRVAELYAELLEL